MNLMTYTMMTMVKGLVYDTCNHYLNCNIFTTHSCFEFFCSYTGLKKSLGQRDLRFNNRSAQGPTKSKSQYVPKQGQGSKFVPRVSSACSTSVCQHLILFPICF